MNDSARRLLELREALGLTQRQLADELGVAASAVAQWETRTHAIPGPVLRILDLYEEQLGLAHSQSARPARLPAPTRSRVSQLASGLWRQLLDGIEGGSLVSRARSAAARRIIHVLALIDLPLRKIAPWSALHEYVQRGSYTTAPARPSLRPSVAARVFLEELGHTPRQLFAEWTADPFAAGSVGQVHRAVTADGREVAVKIQRPDSAPRARRELRKLELAAQAVSVIFPAFGGRVLASELRDRHLDELDYRLEACRQREWKRRLAHQPGLIIPDVIDELSGRRVLTSELARGQPLGSFATAASQRARDHAGAMLWRFYYEPAVRWGQYHADAEPGHFLFGDDSMTVIDFGRVAEWSPTFAAGARQAQRAILERDPRKLERAFVAMGLVADRASFDFEFAYRNLAVVSLPWLREQPFHFTREYFERLWKLAIPRNRNRLTTRQLPELVLLPNLYLLNGLLARLDARVECRRAILSWLYPDGGAPPPYSEDEVRPLAARAWR